MVKSRRGDIAAGEKAGIATLPQESALAARRPADRLATHQENLQAIACNVPWVHSMFIEVSIVPVQDKPLCGGKTL
jgi:hypothetical protein